ncbi:MAG: pyroglutamyl-peptidase I [Janthinobacterium lividum]
MSTILLTGFAPFGDSKTNPSQQVAESLHGEIICGAQVISLTLPVVMGADAEQLTSAIAEHKPHLVLSLGLASGATCLEVERFAINLKVTEADDPSKPLAPNLPQSLIINDGMTALFSTLDTEQIAAAIRTKAGVPARAHGFAGSYACNHILYQTLHYAMQWDLTYKAGFIHLPLSSEQVITENKLHLPSMPLSVMITGVRAAIEEALSSEVEHQMNTK